MKPSPELCPPTAGYYPLIATPKPQENEDVTIENSNPENHEKVRV